MPEVQALFLCFKSIEHDSSEESTRDTKELLAEAIKVVQSFSSSFKEKSNKLKRKLQSNSQEKEDIHKKLIAVDGSSQSKKYFTVAVPEGLRAGSTFTTVINVGETSKKVKLKVPSNESKKLRFSLYV